MAAGAFGRGAALIVDDRWHPGIGDPTAIGWMTVFFYIAAAVLCGVAARRDSSRAPPPRFWEGLAAILLLLAANKQLDLQSLLTQVVRDWTKAHGWYERRRELQAAFIFAVAAIGLAALLVVPYIIRRQEMPRRIALAGLIFLYCFVLVRASSFHHVDWALGVTLLSVRINWLLEIGGIVIVALGALLVVLRPIAAR